MRWGPKTLLAALVVLALGAGLVACGGDDSDSGTTEAREQTSPSGGESSSAADGQPGAGDEEGKPRRDGYGGGQGTPGGSADFTPKQHEDSGGGAEQFRVKGGDNSVQEFGAEADSAEFDEAAAALHNFLDARAAGAWAAACRYMASSVIDSLEELATRSQQPQSCAAVLGKLTNPAAKGLLREEAEAADVGSLRIEDERAFILFRGPENEVLTVPMTREDGAWKVAALASTPLS